MQICIMEKKVMDGGIIQDYMCKRGLKIKVDLNKNSQIYSYHFILISTFFVLSFYIKTARMIVDVRRRA